MTVVEERRCPACRRAMALAPGGDGVWGCAPCGGVWVPRDVLDDLASIANESLAVAKELAAAADPERPARVRFCAKCSAPMLRREHRRVTIDECAEHGAYFDRGELGKVARAAKKKVTRVMDAARSRREREAAEAAGKEGAVIVAAAAVAYAVGLAARSAGDSGEDDWDWGDD